MKLTATFEGMQRLESQIKKMVDAVGYDKVEDVLFDKAEQVRDAIQARTPVGPTGRLKRSPVAKRMPKGQYPMVIAGIDRKVAPHAHLVEFGTVHMAAQPFMRPAWDGLRDKLEEEIGEELGGAIEKVL